MSKLILVRHGQSEWNQKGLWAGLTDVPLTDLGRQEAKQAGEFIKDITIDAVFTSPLVRANDTWLEIKKILNLTIDAIKAYEFRERDYGQLTGKNKWEMKKKFGDEQFLKWRRSWNYPIPGGETLEDVFNRVVPYYKKNILPYLENGKNVLIVAHGNSLRALIKFLENISDQDIPQLELATGAVYIYEIDKTGKVINKEIRGNRENTA